MMFTIVIVFSLLSIYIYIHIHRYYIVRLTKNPFYAIDAHHILLVPGNVGEARPASTQIGGPTKWLFKLDGCPSTVFGLSS